MIDVSIIVPVYNVRFFLERCVQSLLNQTFDNYEIILIDDGSTDGSEVICDNYAKNEEKIKVIHKDNGGLSSARNEGLRRATGEFILFVDSDDYIAPDTCRILHKEAKEKRCDIVCGDSYAATDKGCYIEKKHSPYISVPCDGKTFLAESVLQNAIIMCAPFAMYRRDLIVNNEIWFKNGILHEDELWTPQVYLKAKNVSYVDYEFYFHWQRENSITQSAWTLKRTQDVEDTCKYLAELYKKEYKDIKYRNVMLDYVCMLYLNALNLSRSTDGDKKLLLSTAKKARNVMKTVLYCVSPKLYFKINPNKIEE